MCIDDTRKIQGKNESWGNVSYVELSNDCLDPAAQFRFLDNGAMLNLERPGCFHPLNRAGSGYGLNMFFIYVSSGGLDDVACSGNVDKSTHPAITQTSWGGLSVKYKASIQCAVKKTHKDLANNQGIDTYIGFATNCNDAEDKRFNFGKFP